MRVETRARASRKSYMLQLHNLPLLAGYRAMSGELESVIFSE